MDEYTENDRISDFEYYKSNLKRLFEEYGKCYIAIRNKEILGSYKTLKEAKNALSQSFSTGDYILQKCAEDERAYTTKIMGARISKPIYMKKNCFYF